MEGKERRESDNKESAKGRERESGKAIKGRCMGIKWEGGERETLEEEKGACRTRGVGSSRCCAVIRTLSSCATCPH
jgi:hypothetical protein